MSITGWWTASLNSTRSSLWFLRSRVRVVNEPSPAWCFTQQSANNTACEDHPCVPLSEVSYIVVHTMPLDCQPFVHKHNFSWMLQSGPARELLLRGFAVNINIYLHRAVAILMGGHSSLLRLWNKIPWCAAVPINAVSDSYCIFPF